MTSKLVRPLSDAYFAGLIEGNASISIRKHSNGGFYGRLQGSDREHELMASLKDRFGGALHPIGPEGPKRVPRWKWEARKGDIVPALRATLPYFAVRRNVTLAALVIKLETLFEELGSRKAPELEHLFEKSKRLNKKGPGSRGDPALSDHELNELLREIGMDPWHGPAGIEANESGTAPNILRRALDGSYLVACAFCKGSGRFPESDFEDINERTYDETCPVCEGTSAVWLPPNSDEPSACRRCEGKGRAYDDGYFYGNVCEVCEGVGAVDLTAISRRVEISQPADFWSLLHPAIVQTSRPRFEAGQYADAVEAAFKGFNLEVKQRASSERDGASLMNHVFSANRPILVLADTSTQSGKNIQQGYMQMFAGGMRGIRNPKAHENIDLERERAVHLLFVASLFMYKLEEAKPSDRSPGHSTA